VQQVLLPSHFFTFNFQFCSGAISVRLGLFNHYSSYLKIKFYLIAQMMSPTFELVASRGKYIQKHAKINTCSSEHKTFILLLKPRHSIFLRNPLSITELSGLVFTSTNPNTWTNENHKEIHAENTRGRVVLET